MIKKLKYDIDDIYLAISEDKYYTIIAKDLIDNKEDYKDLLNQNTGTGNLFISMLYCHQPRLFKELLPVLDFKKLLGKNQTFLHRVMDGGNYINLEGVGFLVDYIIANKVPYSDWAAHDKDSVILNPTLHCLIKYREPYRSKLLKSIEECISFDEVLQGLPAILEVGDFLNSFNLFDLKKSFKNVELATNNFTRVIALIDREWLDAYFSPNVEVDKAGFYQLVAKVEQELLTIDKQITSVNKDVASVARRSGL